MKYYQVCWIHKQNPGISNMFCIQCCVSKLLLPEASKLKWFIVSVFFCFYNQQLSALSFISVTGNKCLVFPAPDLLAHSKLNQQSKEMLYLLQVPCTSPSSRPEGLSDAPLFFLPWGRILKGWFFKGRSQIHSGKVNHSQWHCI